MVEPYICPISALYFHSVNYIGPIYCHSVSPISALYFHRVCYIGPIHFRSVNYIKPYIFTEFVISALYISSVIPISSPICWCDQAGRPDYFMQYSGSIFISFPSFLQHLLTIMNNDSLRKISGKAPVRRLNTIQTANLNSEKTCLTFPL